MKFNAILKGEGIATAETFGELVEKVYNVCKMIYNAYIWVTVDDGAKCGKQYYTVDKDGIFKACCLTENNIDFFRNRAK